MRITTYLLPLVFLIFSFTSEENFRSGQMKYSRVKNAYQEKANSLKALYLEKKVTYATQQIFIRIFKKEETLEVWARSKQGEKFTLVKTYPVCSSSGLPGPKRIKGDRQTPEGFYHIDRFNPQSSFHLSLGINYPNSSDKILGQADPGGDIFIHGSCVTIGCVPLTDNLIKEVYILAVEARNNGQSKIPVHIFPCRMNEADVNALKTEYRHDKKLLHFWDNIRPGYEYFEKNKTLPRVSVDAGGLYTFK